MSRLTKKEYKVYQHNFIGELKELRGYDKFDKFTKDTIIKHLFGDWEYDSESDFKLVYRHTPYIKTTTIQRLNWLWLTPLFMVFVMPFQWLFTGSTGFSQGTKIHTVLRYLLGNI